MTTPTLPSGGGSYALEKDGTLTVLEQPEAAYDAATDVPVETVTETPEPEVMVDVAPPKAPRRVAADVKEA